MKQIKLFTLLVAVFCAANLNAQVDAPLTFEAKVAGTQVTYSVSSGELPPVEYSTDGITWTTYSSAITLASAGDKVSFRGNNATYSTGTTLYAHFDCSDHCYIYGNIMSLVDAENYVTATTLTEAYTFYRMFYLNNRIWNHASKDLVLPATTLTESCYYSMFQGCNQLTRVPALPATKLTENCYYSMFYACSSLKAAPALPATELARRCYHSMFEYCDRLKSVPELPATTLAPYCYQSMFWGCFDLTSVPLNMLPATTLANFCYNSMFRGCTSLTTAPVLPATTLASSCYSQMFRGCTGLTTAPVLPVTTLANSCYSQMFSGCTGLTTAPVLPATTLVTNCYYQMFSGCTNLSSMTCYATARDNTNATKDWLNGVAATGTFYAPKNSVFASQERNAGNIPIDWTFIPFQASLITVPTAVEGLVYTGTAQALLNNDGVAEGGTLKYSLDNSTWDAAIPTGTAAGNYTVYYMVQGDETHADYTPSPNTVAASIAKAPLTIKADDKWLDYGDPLEFLVATYTGFVNGEGPGYVQPAVKFSSDYTQGDNAGTYTITPYGAGAANYEITYQPGILHVNKLYAAITTAPTAIEGLVANGSAQTLINAGEATGGEMQYSLDGWVWGTGLPTATDANTYTVYYRVVGDINHYSTSTASFPVTIAPASASMVITANLDPLHAGVYYSTFYDSSVKYALPAGVEAYVADLNGTDLVLTKIAEAGQVLPTNTAVILKAASASITLTVSDAAPVSFRATNDLLGTDVETNDIPANCYVLSGHSTDNTITGVGFYLYTGTLLKAHRAYAIFGGSGAPPRMMRFVFGQEQVPTGTENVSEAAFGSVRKVMVNGQLFIEKDGVRLDVTGKQVR
ncbi:MAG: leucine-rich repeat protein [Paludibacteraceae bacterium]|nr:leucine-rich repeat protein [Paludibacteraceae bacterium]